MNQIVRAGPLGRLDGGATLREGGSTVLPGAVRRAALLEHGDRRLAAPLP